MRNKRKSKNPVTCRPTVDLCDFVKKITQYGTTDIFKHELQQTCAFYVFMPHPHPQHCIL